MSFLSDLLSHKTSRFAPVDREAAVEGMDEGWMVLDSQNIIVDTNPAIERMVGVPREKLYGQPVSSGLSERPNGGQAL